MKFCKDCLHYRRDNDDWAGLDFCAHPSLPLKRDWVRGEPMDHYCSEVRAFNEPCGPDGKLFEAKETTNVVQA